MKESGRDGSRGDRAGGGERGWGDGEREDDLDLELDLDTEETDDSDLAGD